MGSIKFGQEFLSVCREIGLSSYAAVNLGRLSRPTRVIATELGSVAIETNLRALGLIVTDEEWSGCVDVTERGV